MAGTDFTADFPMLANPLQYPGAKTSSIRGVHSPGAQSGRESLFEPFADKSLPVH